MKEQLISFITSKLAQEKGFNVESEMYWANYYNGFPPQKWKLIHEEDRKLRWLEFAAVNQSFLQRWLRETHDLYVIIGLDRTTAPKFFYSVYKYEHFGNYDREENSEYTYRTYEEALEEGLKEALKLI